MTRTGCLCAVLALCALAAWPTAQADYPERKIRAVIPWGKGGATDNLMRALTPLAERALGQQIELMNWRGNSAVTGSRHVLSQRADGYTLLLGAENPQLYPVLGLAEFDYGDFQPINIIAQNTALIAVRNDSPWHSMAQLLAAARANPGSLRMGGTGPGGLPGTVHAMINAVDAFALDVVPFGGDGPGISALREGRIDFMPITLASARESLRSGQLRALAVVARQAHPELPAVAPITEALPGIAEYLPWGPFYGVFVRRDTPDEIKRTLTEAYSRAVASTDFQRFLSNAGTQSLNIHGAEAEAFLKRWQSVTAWSLYKARAIEVSPDSVGIAQP